jgi:hypothetical protein
MQPCRSQILRGIGLFIAVAVSAGVSPEAVSGGQTENVILITLDGVRIQEVFGGMDARLAEHSAEDVYSDIEAVRERFWRDSPEKRREALMPVLWTTLAPMGVVYGNKARGSSVTVRNAIKWSSPGYSEILTGEPQPDVVDNALRRYPHRTVLEYLREAKMLEFHEVAQFGSWDGFRMIAASRDDAFLMNGAYDAVPAALSTPEIDDLVELRRGIMGLWEESSNDTLTFRIATAYLKHNQLRLMWLALGQSDDWAHDDRYDRLLDYLHLADAMLGELWEILQAMEQYRGRTTLVITTDHGRGLSAGDWAEHEATIPGSEDIWLAVIGPDTPDRGEVAPAPPLHQSDIAATLLQFFDLTAADFNADAGPPVPGSFVSQEHAGPARYSTSERESALVSR